MNTKEIKEWLNNREKYKILIQNYNDTIAYYEDCLGSDDKIIELVKIEEEKLTVQKSRNNISPQEVEFNLKCVGRKKAKEEIKKYRDKRNSIFRKMYLLDKSFDYLDKLNKEACFIIECRLIYKMKWNDIDISFNNKFRKEKTIGYDRMQHLMYKGLKEIVDYVESVPITKIDYLHVFKRKCFEVSIGYDLKITESVPKKYRKNTEKKQGF